MFGNLIPWRRDRRSAPARYESRDPFHALAEQMARWFDGACADGDSPGGYLPRVNVSETDDHMTVTAELPGVDEKDVEVTLTGETLTLKGEKKDEHEEKRDGYRHVERHYGSFHRVVRLSDEIDRDKVEAEFRNGVLTITLPKTEAAREHAKRIEVKATA